MKKRITLLLLAVLGMAVQGMAQMSLEIPKFTKVLRQMKIALVFFIMQLFTLTAVAQDDGYVWQNGVLYGLNLKCETPLFPTTTISAFVAGVDYGILSTTLDIPEQIVHEDRAYSVQAIEYRALEGSPFIEISYPCSHVKERAFMNSKQLTTVTMPHVYRHLGDSAFLGCEKLKTINFTDVDTRGSLGFFALLKGFGKRCFAGCESLESFDFGDIKSGNGDKYLTIYDYAFENCTALKEIFFSEKMPMTINDYAFTGCTALKDIWITEPLYPDYSMIIHENSFDDETYEHAILHVPDNMVSSYRRSKWGKFVHIEGLSGINGVLFSNATVESLCLAHWDQNGDGVFSEEEAAAVTDLGKVFMGNQYITSFDELKYFVNLEEINSHAFEGCSKLQSVSIPISVTTIGTDAFKDCIMLSSVELPENLEYLYDNAFDGCNALTSVNIPKNVYAQAGMIFCSGSFSNCRNLTEITVDSENPYLIAIDGVLYTKTKKDLLQYPAGKRNQYFEIPEGVTYLTGGPFWGSVNLKSVKIPSSVTILNGSVFSGCEGLTEIEIPENAKFVEGTTRFIWGCTNLSKVISHITEPTNITETLFYVNSSMTTATLYVPAGTKDKYQQCTGWKNFQNIVEMESEELKNGDLFTAPTVEGVDMTFIVRDAMNKTCWVGCDNSSVKAVATSTSGTVTIPSSANGYEVKGVSPYAFLDCDKLTGIIVPEGVDSIYYGAFARCHSLTQLELPNSLTFLWSFAFYDCINLASISLGNGLKTIGEAAFYNCESLKSISIPNSVTAISSNTFRNCINLASVSLGNGLKKIGEAAFCNCESLKSISIPNSVTAISSYTFLGCKNLTSIALPMTVDEIGIGAFAGTSITSIALPEQLLTIGEQAFADSKLRALNIPKNVSNIGIAIVGGCREMLSLTVDAANSCYRSTGNAIIDRSTNMLVNACPATVIPTDIDGIGNLGFYYVQGVEEIIIPDNVRTIGKAAFEECGDLKRVSIPASIESIGNEAFLQCTSLEQVTILNPTPVSINENVFHMTETSNEDGAGAVTSDFTTATLYVPYGSKSAYQQAEGWKNFQNIVEMEAPDITIALDESSKISNCWFAANSNQFGGSKDEIHVNAPVPGMPGANIHSWTDNVFYTFTSGRPKLTVSGADANSITPLLAFRSAGNLRASSNGDALLCNADTIAKVEEETGVVTMVMSDSTMSRLNRAASDDYANALTLPLCVKARYNGTVYDVAGGDFAAKVLRPINAGGKELAEQDITTGSVTLKLGELVALTDWRDYSINKRELFDFYDIESITVTGATNSSNVGSAIKASVNGSWVSVSSATDKLAFTYQPKSLWDNAAGSMPDYGTLTIANNGFSGDMQLLIPVTVSYAWGKVQASAYVSVTAVQAEPKLVMTEMDIEGDGIVGAPLTYKVYIQNQGQGDFSGSLYVWFKENNWSEAEFSSGASGTIEAGGQAWFQYSYGEYYYFYFTSPGTYRFWLTTDAEGQQPIEGEKILVVTPAATLTAKSYTREYGEENPDFGYTADKGGFNGTPTITCEADKYSDVGTYDIVIEQGSVDNDYVTLVNGTLTITKSPLTVKATSYYMRQEGEIPPYSATYEGFKNGDDESVLTKTPQFNCSVTPYSSMGDYTIYVSGVEAKNYEPYYETGFVRLVGRAGDVNRDTYVNTTDVVDVVQFIFGYQNVQAVYDADLNLDDNITSTDVSLVVNCIMNNDRPASRLKTPAATGNCLMSLSQDENGQLAVSLHNDVSVVAFQFDVVLPEETDISKVLLSEARINGHSVAMRQMENGRWRVLAYSMQNNTLMGNDGLLATLHLDDVDGEVVLTNIHVTDAQLADYALPDVSLSMLTGISTLTEATATFDVYDLNGRLVRRHATSTKGLHRGIYMINNQKVVIK